MTYQITAPVEGFTGTVAGVDFAKGKGETDDVNAVAYFNRHGYKVETKTARRAKAEDK